MTPSEYKAIYESAAAKQKHENTRRVMRDNLVSDLSQAACELFDSMPFDMAEVAIEDAMVALMHAKKVASAGKQKQAEPAPAPVAPAPVQDDEAIYLNPNRDKRNAALNALLTEAMKAFKKHSFDDAMEIIAHGRLAMDIEAEHCLERAMWKELTQILCETEFNGKGDVLAKRALELALILGVDISLVYY